MNSKLLLMPSLTLMFMMQACGGKSSEKHSAYYPKEFDELKSIVMSDSLVVSDIFKFPTWTVSDDGVCILDPSSKGKLIKLYDSSNGELVDSALNVGQGPDEYIVVNPGEACGYNSLLLYDIMGKRLSLVDFSLKDGIKVRENLTLFSDSTGMTYPYTYITQINDSLFLMKDDEFDGTYFEVADLRNGRSLSKMKNLTRAEGMGYAPFDYIQCVSGNNIIAAAYCSLDRIEFYELRNDSVVPLKSYGSPEYKEMEGAEDRPRYALSIAENGDNFYVLTSDGESPVSKTVEVYTSKSADKRYKLMLDREISDLRISQGGDLVGLAQTEGGTVFYIWKI